jgi:hypothetical protein
VTESAQNLNGTTNSGNGIVINAGGKVSAATVATDGNIDQGMAKPMAVHDRHEPAVGIEFLRLL